MAKIHVPLAGKSAIDSGDVAKVLKILKGMNLDISDIAFGNSARFIHAAEDCNQKTPPGCDGVVCPHKSSACATLACSDKVCADLVCGSVSCKGVTCSNYHHWGDESSALGALSEAIAKLPSGSWSQISCSPNSEIRPG